MRNIYLILIFSSLSSFLFGQTKKAFLEAADKAYEEKNYYAALRYYDEALEFNREDTSVLFKSAEAARQFNSYKIAAQRYQYLLDTMQYQGSPELKFHLAQMLQKMGKYQEAQSYYNLYLSEFGEEDSKLTAIAKKELEAVDWAKNQEIKTEELYTLSKVEGVNTPYSDFGALKIGDTLYYTSMQFENEKDKDFPRPKISKVLKSNFDNPDNQVLDVEWNKLNISSAHTAFSGDGKTLYYTLCDYNSKSTLRCDIYSCAQNGDTWVNSKKLEFNQDSVTNTHPAIGLDPVMGKDALYFVSDREGGKGGLDIYYVILDKNMGFSEPINFSEVNTSADDVTPFYHQPSNTLYFSSNGRMGYGSFDIYKVDLKSLNHVELLDAPINSSYDDLYFTANNELSQYLFSSNREGSQFVDSYYEACCFDIYKADVNDLEINLTALTFDNSNGEPLDGVRVKVYDKNTGVLLFDSYLDDSNEHKFKLQRGKEYTIVAEKDHYLPDTINLSTKDIYKSEDIVKKLYLNLEDVMLDVFTFDNDTKNPLEGVTVTLEEIGNPENKVVLINPTANDFNFVIEKGKQYKLLAVKPDYFPVTETIDTRDMKEGGRIRKDLYLDRYALEKFLPVTLYFDNDIPDNRSKSTSTNRSYSELLDLYVRKKQEFKDVFCVPLNNVETQKACDELETFFEGDVKGGYDMLRIFMDVLFKELAAGRTIELSIRGYASPRAETKYNLVLGQRRVNTIRNEMMQYKNGLLADYLKTGQLTVTDISYGEELAPSDVVSDLNNKRLSIYSPEASKQRKVEIVKIVKN